ncbi:hypothetical protein [Mesorhizobium hawassense]|nr:hypothetical protein [Mesorhizobium hawassense]
MIVDFSPADGLRLIEAEFVQGFKVRLAVAGRLAAQHFCMHLIF